MTDLHIYIYQVDLFNWCNLIGSKELDGHKTFTEKKKKNHKRKKNITCVRIYLIPFKQTSGSPYVRGRVKNNFVLLTVILTEDKHCRRKRGKNTCIGPIPINIKFYLCRHGGRVRNPFSVHPLGGRIQKTYSIHHI